MSHEHQEHLCLGTSKSRVHHAAGVTAGYVARDVHLGLGQIALFLLGLTPLCHAQVEAAHGLLCFHALTDLNQQAL